MENDKVQNKKVYFEMMRVIACALVIFNHLPGYTLYFVSKGGKQFFYMCLTMITRINVPLFFMISGALLLGRNDEWVIAFKKRFIRIVVLLLVFDFIVMSSYKIVKMGSGVEYEFSLSKYIHGFLENKMDGSGAYWYLYSYLGILFLLPMLQRVAKGITKNEIIALVTMHFILFSLLPLININMLKMQLPTYALSDSFSVPFAFEKAFFYSLLGYYLENYIDMNKIKIKHLCGLIVAGAIGILLSNWCTYNDAILNGQYSQDYVQLFDYLTTIVAFILIKYLFVIGKPKLNEGIIARIICLIGSLTLGIYMLEPCVRLLFYIKYENFAEPKLPTLIVSIGWIIISMTCGGLTTYILKKIPGIKRIV